VITSIKSISVPIRDQARAIAFWTQKFGFTIASDQPFDSSRQWIELRIPGADTRLVLSTPDTLATHDDLAHVAFTVDDVARTYAELRAKGVEFDGPVRRTDWGSQATFQDSEGNRFVISSRA
jgi:catechol 2,3-dioxygenase-like lactoylglutathione lyase family enzyme